MGNPLAELIGLGQSPWLDGFRRGMLASGELSRLIEEGIRGSMSVPAPGKR